MINNNFLDRRLDEALSTPMEIMFSDKFAYQVSRKIELRNLAVDKKIQNISLIASIFFTIVSILLLVIILNDAILTEFKNWGGWAVTFGVLVLIFQLIENKIMRKKATFS